MGKITNWKELGGPNVKIVVVSRDTNSGTYETFEKLVMAKQKIAEGAEYVGSNGQARQRVLSTPGAIGYVGLGFVKGVKALAINGIKPSRATIATGLYPVARPLYMFTNGYPKLGSHVHRFVTLHLTPKGQEIIEAKGFVPVTDYPAGSRLVDDQE
jgi:phosphate transport system substrate-binding protein